MDAGLTTLSSRTPSRNDSSSILPSARAILTRCSIRFTSLNLFFFELDGLLLLGEEEGMVDDDAAGEPGAKTVEAEADDTPALGSIASRNVSSSCKRRLWVANTEHLRHIQSFRISRRV